jgi:divalent anion:Na+ symporter, DASS family
VPAAAIGSKEKEDARRVTRRVLWRWFAVLVPGVALYFLPLAGMSPVQRHLLAVFVATIVALVAQPVRMGVSVVLAMTLLAITGTLSAAKALSGFSNVTVWLIFSAFLFARAVTATGFGTRLGYLFIRRFAHTPLRLAYSMAAADLVLAPFIPSDTGRGGGIIFPITRSVAAAFGSEPGPTARRIGSYLMLVSFHTTYVGSAMFLTGMASNPLIADFARRIAHVDLTWLAWLRGSSLPGLLTLTIVPWLLLRLMKPEIQDTAPAQEFAAAELHRMGPLNAREKRLIVILAAVMAGWVTSPWHGISNTIVALAGLCAILLTGVLSWDEFLEERRAWDALVWFAPLLMMADALNDAGVIRILSGKLFHAMGGWPWPLALIALATAYLYIHYTFASMTAQVTALYPSFLGAGIAAGIPPMLATLPLAYFSNLNAGMTHYGTGSAPVFFGAGYVRQSDWWRIGFVISLLNLAIWMGIGPLWWKITGLY